MIPKDELYKVMVWTYFMLKFWQKIFVFQVVAALSAALPVFAQNFTIENPTKGVSGQVRGIESTSFDDFISTDESRGGRTLRHKSSGQLLSDMMGKEGARTILCGSATNICDLDTQDCYSCHSGEVMGIGSDYYKQVTGKCFPKNVQRSELQKWCSSYETWQPSPFGGGYYKMVNREYRKEDEAFLLSTNISGLWGLISSTSVLKEYFVDKDNKKYYLAYDRGNPTLKYAEGGNTEDCEVLPIKLNKMSGCFFCPLARVIFDTANTAAGISFGKFAPSFQNLIAVAFALWLAFASLNVVFTLTKQDASKYITSMLKQGGKFMFAYFLLTYEQDLFRLFISPILSTGLEMGDKIKAFGQLKSQVDLGGDYVASVGGEYFAAGGIYNKIEAFLRGVQQQLAVLQAVGSSLFCVAGNELSWKALINKKYIVYSVKDFFLGAILFIFGLLLTVSFAFYFMDALLQLSILGAMLPMMIAGWPFKVTAKYATEGLKMLLNTTFIMFFTGFVISVEITLIDSALEFVNEDRAHMDAGTGKGLTGLFNAINNQDSEAIRKLTDIKHRT